MIHIWVFPKLGVPQNGWFIMEHPVKWMIWGYPYFRKHPYIYIYIYNYIYNIDDKAFHFFTTSSCSALTQVHLCRALHHRIDPEDLCWRPRVLVVRGVGMELFGCHSATGCHSRSSTAKAPAKMDGWKRILSFSRWWFQMFFMFTPTWGRFPLWLIFFNSVETTFFTGELLNVRGVWIFWEQRVGRICFKKAEHTIRDNTWKSHKIGDTQFHKTSQISRIQLFDLDASKFHVFFSVLQTH